MGRLLPVCFFLMVTLSVHAQQLKKYPIGKSGCQAYFICNPGSFDMDFSDDSSLVYTGSCKASDSLTYGLICVQLKETVETGLVSEDLLISYLDYLKTIYNIEAAAGYGKGHTMANKPDAQGMIDYWQDKEGLQWKVKGWIDGKFIAVMYVYGQKAPDESSKTNVFLDGFRFPGM